MADPAGVLDDRFSSPDAAATTWTEARSVLADAELFWLTTVCNEGRPHVTPIAMVWLDDALHFCIGLDEPTGVHLRARPRVVATTSQLTDGPSLEVVVEGTAEPIIGSDRLSRLANRYRCEYGWEFAVTGDCLRGDDGTTGTVYRLCASTAFAFERGRQFAQTRWEFPHNLQDAGY